MSKSAIGRKNMPFSAIARVWLGEYRAFVVECFTKIESYLVVQCAVYKKIKLKIHDSVLSCVAIETLIVKTTIVNF